MKLLPKRGAAAQAETAVPEQEPTVTAVDGRGTPKGRPTPKRREAGGGARGPAAPPPKTRKEAYRFQKEQTAKARAAKATGAPVSREAYREALRRGDPAALPKRDQGPLKALARDYVDSRPMLSNFLLLAFIPLLLGPFVASGAPVVGQYLQLATFAILIVVIGEWYVTGRKLRKVAQERGIALTGSNLSIGFYAGSRAYLPRRWRLPAPRKARGDQW